MDSLNSVEVTENNEEELNAKKADVQAQIDAKQAEIDKANDELEKLNEEKKELEETLEELNETNEELIENRDRIEKEISEKASDTVKKLLETYQEKRTTFEEVKTERTETLKEEVETAQNDVQEIDEKITELKNQQKEEENSFTGASGKLAEIFENSSFAKGVLAKMGDFVEEACTKYGVDPYLASAIMASETGWGTSNAIVNSNNPGGYMDSATNYQTVKKFSSLEEGIEAVVKNLANGYINQGLTTISSIGAKYCPVGAANDPTGLNSNWIPTVTSIYNDLSGKNIDENTRLV